MSNQIEQVRRLAAAVADRKTNEVAFGLFRLYVAAAGATLSGSWVYVPGRATPLKGWRRAAEYIALLPETSGFLRNLAEAHALALDATGSPSKPATVDELGQVAGAVADLAKQLAQLADSPPPAPVDTTAVVIGDDAYLSTLLEADGELMRRIVKRAQYDALKVMLEGVDAWVETARENAEAGVGSRADAEQFHADDIRNMINDAARELGVRPPWRA